MARRLFSMTSPEPLSWDVEVDGEELEWEPGEEGIEKWVESSGAEFLGYREPNLIDSGTPSFCVSGFLQHHLATFPMHHIDCGGASVHMVADDGEAVVWIEDWLSGCLPSGFAAEGLGYGDEIVAEHIQDVVNRKVGKISGLLGAGWRLRSAKPGSDSDPPASRAVWIKRPDPPSFPSLTHL